MVNLEWYRSFLEVYRTGTVSAAARSLFLTQPTVTNHIASLESSVGGSLFSRTPRKMIPTERGKELYVEVVQAVETLESVSQNLKRNQASEKPLFRLGAPFEYFYERILNQIGELEFRFWIQFGLTQFLIDELKQGSFDAIVVTQKVSLPELEYKKLSDETFILVGSAKMKHYAGKKWNPAKADEIEAWLIEQEWLSYGVELPIIRRFWQEAFKRRLEIKPAFVMPNLHAILKGVELGYGISLLPEYLCQDALKQKRVKILLNTSTLARNEIWLAYRKTERKHPLIKEFCLQLNVTD